MPFVAVCLVVAAGGAMLGAAVDWVWERWDARRSHRSLVLYQGGGRDPHPMAPWSRRPGQ